MITLVGKLNSKFCKKFIIFTKYQTVKNIYPYYVR